MSPPVKVTLPVLWLSLSFAKIVNCKIPVDKARVVICSIQFSEVVTVYSTFASTLISIVPPSPYKNSIQLLLDHFYRFSQSAFSVNEGYLS